MHTDARRRSRTGSRRGLGAGPAGLPGRREADAGRVGAAAAQASEAAGGASVNRLKEGGAALEFWRRRRAESGSRPLRAYTAAASLIPCARAEAAAPDWAADRKSPSSPSGASRGRASFSSLRGRFQNSESLESRRERR